MTYRTIKFPLLLVVILSALPGCQPPCPPVENLVPPEQIITEYNENAAKVPRLWARARIAIKGKLLNGLPFSYGSTSTLAEPNGLVILRKNPDNLAGPQDFVLIVREAGKEMARLGISLADGVYYFWNLPNKTCWYGQLANAGAPDVKVPIDPTQIPSVLGICELPADQTQPPLLAQSISTRPCAQVLMLLQRQPSTNKLLFSREMFFPWVEEVSLPHRLFMVKMFDLLGRRVMTAQLKNYQAIELTDVDNKNFAPAHMPTDIRLQWDDTGDEIHLVLSEMTTADKFDPAVFYFFDRLEPSLRKVMRSVDPKGTSKR